MNREPMDEETEKLFYRLANKKSRLLDKLKKIEEEIQKFNEEHKCKKQH